MLHSKWWSRIWTVVQQNSREAEILSGHLHKLGFPHKDVRIDRIIVTIKGCTVLIDLEFRYLVEMDVIAISQKNGVYQHKIHLN